MDNHSCESAIVISMDELKPGANAFKLILVAVLLLCVCLAALVFINSSSEIYVAVILRNPLLIPALITQFAASTLFVVAWKILLEMQTSTVFGLRECAAQVGVTLLGKYLPGKIWGLVGRTYLLTRREQSSGDAMSLLLTDQFITFYTGIMIGTVALLAYYSPALAALMALIITATVPAASKRCDRIVAWVLAHATSFIRKLAPKLDVGVIAIQPRQFILSFLCYTLHWLSTAAVLCLLFYPAISAELFLNCTLIIAAIPLAMMSGFLAIWAPGGIGVREAVIVAILAQQLPLELAATIAITYRLICILIDLGIGGFAFFYYSGNGPAPQKDD